MSFSTGCGVGILGGLIGLGGAEFRLPLLLTVFGYRALQAVVINLVVSLVTVIFSFVFRLGVINLDLVLAHSSVIANILAGSLIGSYNYFGANFAARVRETLLKRTVVVVLIMLSLLLMGHPLIGEAKGFALTGPAMRASGFFSGMVIGAVSSLLGVAGGELIIPAIVLIFSLDIKLAGSLSLAISIPTILMGLFKYRRMQQLKQVGSERALVIWMALGSVLGSLIGSYFLRFASSAQLHFLLGIVLLISALKLLSHSKR